MGFTRREFLKLSAGVGLAVAVPSFALSKETSTILINQVIELWEPLIITTDTLIIDRCRFIAKASMNNMLVIPEWNERTCKIQNSIFEGNEFVSDADIRIIKIKGKRVDIYNTALWS